MLHHKGFITMSDCDILKMDLCRFPACFDCFCVRNMTEVAECYTTVLIDKVR